jgi:hypothetical protein
MTTSDLDELKALCAEWQERLRLQDWDIFLEIKRFHEMDEATHLGNAHVVPKYHSARIALVHPDDYYTDAWRPYDMEFILVHECLHIWTKQLNLDDTDAISTHEEMMINALARALVKLKREAHP